MQKVESPVVIIILKNKERPDNFHNHIVLQYCLEPTHTSVVVFLRPTLKHGSKVPSPMGLSTSTATTRVVLDRPKAKTVRATMEQIVLKMAVDLTPKRSTIHEAMNPHTVMRRPQAP